MSERQAQRARLVKETLTLGQEAVNTAAVEGDHRTILAGLNLTITALVLNALEDQQAVLERIAVALEAKS